MDFWQAINKASKQMVGPGIDSFKSNILLLLFLPLLTTTSFFFFPFILLFLLIFHSTSSHFFFPSSLSPFIVVTVVILVVFILFLLFHLLVILSAYFVLFILIFFLLFLPLFFPFLSFFDFPLITHPLPFLLSVHLSEILSPAPTHSSTPYSHSMKPELCDTSNINKPDHIVQACSVDTPRLLKRIPIDRLTIVVYKQHVTVRFDFV